MSYNEKPIGFLLKGVFVPFEQVTFPLAGRTDEVIAVFSRDQLDVLIEALHSLYDWALDACHQGTGNPFEPGRPWHLHMSTWEQADELLPDIAKVLGYE